MATVVCDDIPTSACRVVSRFVVTNPQDDPSPSVTTPRLYDYYATDSTDSTATATDGTQEGEYPTVEGRIAVVFIFVFVVVSVTRSACPSEKAQAPLIELHALDGTLSVIIEWLPSTVRARVRENRGTAQS
jgi:hypothetical protein